MKNLLTYIIEYMCINESFDNAFDTMNDAISYINSHYHERIVASDLSEILGIGRTTLMTSIKKHTGLTLSEYILRVRLKKSVELLQKGVSQEKTASETGFCNGSGIIRAFRRCYGMTPKQYIKNSNKYN